MEGFDQMELEERKRPGLLTVLSILSFIYIGINLISNITQFFSGPYSEDQMYEMKVQSSEQITEMKSLGIDWAVEMLEKSQRMMEDINNHYYFALVITLVSLILGLVGVVMMLKQRKLGFHLYIIYNIISIGGLFLYVSPGNVPLFATIFNVILAGLFIFLYSRTLGYMTK